MKVNYVFYCLLPLMLAACASHAPEHVRSEGQWQVMIVNPGKSDMLCYAGATPVRSSGSIGKRDGTPYLMATRRASGAIEISASSGYTYMRGSRVEAAAGDETHGLYFKTSVAWAYNNGEDEEIIHMIATTDEDEVEIRGVSQSGATSIDYYPTEGFAAAIQRIRALCP